MTIGTRLWLPADAVPPPALRALFEEAIAGWSARWFTGDRMHLAPLRREVRAELAWRSLDAGLMLGTTSDTALLVGALMLDVTAEDRAEHERALLEKVAEHCLVDLRGRLAKLVDATASAAWRPAVRTSGWCAAIGAPAAKLAVAFTDPLFASLVARVLPASALIPLGSGAAALAALEVTVSAAVGHAQLSVADLRTLEVGDVVVLDSRLADPVPVAVDGYPLSRGTTRVVAAEPPFLEIVQTLTRA